MKQEILDKLQQPEALEQLYQSDRARFKNAFVEVYPEISENPVAATWQARLNYHKPDLTWGTRQEWGIILLSIFLAGILAKLQQILAIDEDFFFSRNIAFIVLPFLTIFFAWRFQLSTTRSLIIGAVFVAAALYMNLLPDMRQSHTILLACIHMPLFLWSVLGFTYTGKDFMDLGRRTAFLQFTGDLVVMSGLLLIAGMLLTGISFGLFELISINLEHFFEEVVLVWGLPAVPILATFLITVNPQLVNRVSPVIARVFTPLVLFTLVAYLFAVFYTGKDPYNDREFLMIFNLLLIGVVAIILFSVSETEEESRSRWTPALLLSLSVVTIVVNTIALSAILFRISEWGMSPNRLAVLGGNLLILINLLLVFFRLWQSVIGRGSTGKVKDSIAAYLPIYSLWTLVVVLLFPLIFGF